jgi:AcrR family transcriptional regulator
MGAGERQLRADAERNRKRLLAAATELFCERGLDVGVAEIAQRAGVGRGTLFRNFPTKEDLIAAIVVERMNEAVRTGEAMLTASDPEEALFEFLREVTGRQQLDRALFEATAEAWLANDEIRAAHARVVRTLAQLLERAQRAGTVRADVGAVDVLFLLKGICEVGTALAHVDPGIVERQLDLVRAALGASAATRPLAGHAPTLMDVERALQGVPSGRAPAARRAAG